MIGASEPAKCPIGLDAKDAQEFCSAGTCAECTKRRIEWKIKEGGLPAHPGKGMHYLLLDDEVVVGFDHVPDEVRPPYTQLQLEGRALQSLRQTANQARHSYRHMYWEYTTNGVMSNDLEEAADIMERARPSGYNEGLEDAVKFMRLEIEKLERIGTPSHVNRARMLSAMAEQMLRFKKEVP